MRAELRHRAYHFADQIHHSIESAFFTAGALLLAHSLPWAVGRKTVSGDTMAQRD